MTSNRLQGHEEEAFQAYLDFCVNVEGIKKRESSVISIEIKQWLLLWGKIEQNQIDESSIKKLNELAIIIFKKGFYNNSSDSFWGKVRRVAAPSQLRIG